jgi:hypothetical protein
MDEHDGDADKQAWVVDMKRRKVRPAKNGGQAEEAGPK